MARGNIQTSHRFCHTCMTIQIAERKTATWGAKDIIWGLFSLGLWVIVRVALNKLSNAWRCKICGTKIK